MAPLSPAEPCRSLGAVPVDGGASFRVWAPKATSLELHVIDGDRFVPLAPTEKGYFAGVVAGLGAGARYRYRLDGIRELADPCSRFQPEGVHGPSEVVDLADFEWSDAGFVPAALPRMVIYELHVGTFSEEGTFDGALGHLDHLVELGVNAVEIMPVAQFPGRRNWGYDGVFLFAVQDSYGGPPGLQRFVDRCHRRGLAVVADVVHNHFGPEGCVLDDFGPYVTDRYATPWGPAVNVELAGSDEVRRFLIESALGYFADFHVDALRLDAVHGIIDRSAHPFLAELAEATRRLGAELGRPLRLIAESADNDPRVVAPSSAGGYGLDAQWCDDFHHSLHVLITGEREGYYADYGRPEQLARAMVEGFSFQGEYSAFRGRRHGATPASPAPHHFVAFTQNHDQIGNRGGAERLSALVSLPRLALAAALVLLSPSIPLLFMGEEYGETAPFPYFVDHSDPTLLEAVRAGRAAEFAAGRDLLDPAAEETFEAARPDRALRKEPGHAELYGLYRRLIEIRNHFSLFSDACVTTSEAHAAGSLVVLRRSRPGESLLTLFNTGDGEETYQLPPASPSTVTGAGTWHTIVDCDTDELGGTSPAPGYELHAGASLRLRAFGFASFHSSEQDDA
jgi:maltooligosyltrehalose trehalohydrolase